MTTELGGLLGTTSIVAYGDSATGVSIVGGTIDTTTLTNLAFSMPRDGTITSIAGFFSVTVGLSLVGSTVGITAQLFSSTTPDDIFTPIPGALVTLAPPLTGVVPIGATSSGLTTGLTIPVTAGTRLILVFSAAVIAGIDVATTITGNASAGVSIA